MPQDSVNEELFHDYNNGYYKSCLSLIEGLRDPSKRELNRALITFAQGKWLNVDQYRSTLMRLAPDIRGDAQTVVASRNITSLYNLAVVYFHAGQYKTAISLLDKIDPANNEKEYTYIKAPTLRLKAEIMIQMCHPERALSYLEQAQKHIASSGPYTETLVGCILRARQRATLMLKRDLSDKTRQGGHGIEHYEMLLFAHELCLLGDLRKALACLVQAMESRPGGACDLLSNNALGCVYGSMGKHNLALAYFQKAAALTSIKDGCRDARHAGNVTLRESSRPCVAESCFMVSRGLLQMPLVMKACVMYNVGVALLHSGQGHAALDCLLSVLQVYSRNPRLWLRLAECCICEQKNGNSYILNKSGKREIIQSVIGSGPHRKLLLKTACSDNITDGGGGSGAIPMTTLEFGCLCVRNCLALLPAYGDYKQDLSALQYKHGRHSNRSFPAPPGAPLTVAEVHRLRCSALCDLSFIYLCMGEILMASSTASTLLEMQSHLSAVHLTLARLYLAETYILMDKTDEAEQLLEPTLVQDVTCPELWNGPVPPSSWFPDSTDNMRAIVGHNLALFHTANGNYKRATEVLAQISDCRMPVHGIFLNLYLLLKTGDFDKAKAMLKDQTFSMKTK